MCWRCRSAGTGKGRAERRVAHLGGAILKTENSVRGTATAASLWATGATGAAVGLGAYDVAVVISLFTFLTLWLLAPFKQEAKK